MSGEVRRTPVRDAAIVGVLAAIATTYVMWPLLTVAGSHFAFQAGDAVVNAWTLAWGGDRIAHGLHGFWSPPILYPYANTLAYSENLLGIAVVVAPVQWLWENPTLTYNVALLLSFVVSAVGGFVLVRELTGSRAAGLIAGFAFAFTPYRWAQLTHLQVLWTAWLPFALAGLHRALRRQNWSSWALFLAAALLQVLSYGYSVFQVALAVGVIVCVSVARSGLDRTRIRRMAITAAVLVLLLLPAIAAYYGVWKTREPTPGDLVTYSADLSSYLSVYPDLPDAAWLPGLVEDEGNLFPGVVVVVLALVAFAPMWRWRPITRWRWVYALLAVLAVFVSLGPEPRAWGFPLPFPGVYNWLLSTVPLFNALRVPARFGMLAILAITILAGLGFHRVMAGADRRWRLSAAALLVPLIVWEGYGGPLAVTPTPAMLTETDTQVNAWLAGQPPGAVLYLPNRGLEDGAHVRRQYGTLTHGHPITGGISRVASPLMEFLSGSISPFAQPELIADTMPFLRALGIRYVLMRPAALLDSPLGAQVLAVFEACPFVAERARFGDVVAWEIEPDDAPASGRAPELTAVPSGSLSLSASDHADTLALAIDGDPVSRWLTNRPQDGTEWFEIALDRPRVLAGIDLVVHPRSLSDYPRILEIVAQSGVGGSPESVVYKGSVLVPLGRGWRKTPELPVISIAFAPQMTARLRLRQLGHASPWFWAIDELVLWERK